MPDNITPTDGGQDNAPLTHYDKVIQVFHSEMREKHKLPEGLEKRWFDSAIVDFSLDITPITFDEESKNFTNVLSDKIGILIRVLGMMMEVSRLKRERSRIDALVNIVGRDITLNSTADAKKAIKASHDDQIRDLNTRLHKLKTHSFN
jgi:hypothetical protein